VYGTQGLKQLWRAYYRRELQPPLRGMVMSAVGLVGLNIKRLGSDGFDWNKERLALSNFDMCRRDIEFINALPHNQLCERCQSKKMKYCYCQLGNQRCKKGQTKPSTSKEAEAESSISNCQRPLDLDVRNAPAGTVRIQAQDDHTWEPYFSKNEFSIWRRQERSSLYSYKVIKLLLISDITYLYSLFFAQVYARFEDIIILLSLAILLLQLVLQFLNVECLGIEQRLVDQLTIGTLLLFVLELQIPTRSRGKHLAHQREVRPDDLQATIETYCFIGRPERRALVAFVETIITCSVDKKLYKSVPF